MATIADMNATLNLVVPKLDAAVTENASLKATITSLEAQLAGLSGSTTLTATDQALVDAMEATLQAELAKLP